MDGFVDARAIATRWREEMDLGELTSALLAESGLRGTPVDLVAIGKASREMSAAVVDVTRYEGATSHHRL